MKRYILSAMMSLLLFAGSAFATGQTPQAKEKSEAEKYIQQLAKIKASEIDYAYISATMFKQMFSMVGAEFELQGIPHPIASIKSLRKFATTGPVGYSVLKKHIAPFLKEDDKVMGMELMALNREGSTLTVIYSGSDNILVVSDSDKEISLLFIIGLDYESFEVINESGIEIGF